MISTQIDVPRLYPAQAELAAVAMFALAVDAHVSGNIILFRALTYRLTQLGWRVTPLERSEGGVEQ